jgi:hypothetical protein
MAQLHLGTSAWAAAGTLQQRTGESAPCPFLLIYREESGAGRDPGKPTRLSMTPPSELRPSAALALLVLCTSPLAPLKGGTWRNSDRLLLPPTYALPYTRHLRAGVGRFGLSHIRSTPVALAESYISPFLCFFRQLPRPPPCKSAPAF